MVRKMCRGGRLGVEGVQVQEAGVGEVEGTLCKAVTRTYCALMAQLSSAPPPAAATEKPY